MTTKQLPCRDMEMPEEIWVSTPLDVFKCTIDTGTPPNKEKYTLYKRADKPAHAPSITDGEVAEAVERVQRYVSQDDENCGDLKYEDLETLIRSADRCIDAEFALSCAEKRIAELEEEAANYRYRLADHAKLAEEITRLKAQIAAAQAIENSLCIVLPMAKAFAHSNNVGNNVQMVKDAYDELTTYRATKGDKNV